MKRSFFPALMIFLMSTLSLHVNAAVAADLTLSSDFAAAWNSGASAITVKGVQVAGMDIPAIILTNPLNTFSGAAVLLSGADNTPGYTIGTNALSLGSSTLAFVPGWDYGLEATIENIAIYGATNGAVSYTGNGTGTHKLSIDKAALFNNTGGAMGGAVNVQSQMQSSAANEYIITDTYFISNSAASGGAVAMSANNSIFTTAPNTFSVTSSVGGLGNSVDLHIFALNKATAGNGGGLYFMGNNALGVNNNFITKGYSYYQNSATGLGGAVYIGALNGNDPSVNNFSVTDNNFIENQAMSGGAVATSINGGSRGVNVTIDGLFSGNIASNNGGAIYNAVGDQYSPFGGTINFTISGPLLDNRAANGGAIYNDLKPGQSNVTVNILADSSAAPADPTMLFRNTASGKGGAIYNSAGNNNPGTAIVNVEDGVILWGNSANMGGAIYNDGNGIINLNTGATGISFADNSASSSANGADIYQASASAAINITGTGGGGAVDVNGGIAGIGTINQRAGTILNLGDKSQSFDFKGVFNQASGATLNAYGLMFGGTNNIGGTANIHSGLDSVYFNANMLSGSRMNYESSSTGRVTIGAATSDSAPGIQFKGAGASLNFTKENFYGGGQDLTQPQALFSLTNKIDNGRANTIEFAHSDVTFGSTDFTGGTAYDFWDNSTINLAGPLAPYQQYNFTTLNTNGAPFGASSSLLSFRVGNEQGSLLSDTINVAGGGGLLGLGRVYVNDSTGLLTGLRRVIYGTVLNFENGQSQYVATSNGTYKVTAVNDQYIQFESQSSPDAGATTSTGVDLTNGSTTSTTDHTGSGGGSTETVTAPDGGSSTTITSGGTTVIVTTTPDGNTTITGSPPPGTPSDVPKGTSTGIDLGGGATINIGPGGGATTTTVTIPDGGGGTSTTTITTDTQGGGSTVNNPDGSTASTTTDGSGGATGTVTKTTDTPTILVLNDVNELDAPATGLGMSSGTPRSFQIGDETYQNAANLDTMAAGTFSVHGQTAGGRAATLSGLNEADDSTRQSLFDIQNNGTSFNLQDMTVENAYSGAGGSVLNMNNGDSTATLDNLLIRNNESGADGGAVNVANGTVTSTNVDYQGNKAGGNGGAIANTGGGNTSVSGGSFTNNEAGGDGGAIYNNSTNDMTIASGVGLTFTGNTAAGEGGAVYNGAGNTLTLVADSYKTDDPNDGSIVFSGNTAGGTPNDIHNEGDLVFTGSGGMIVLEGGVSGSPGTGTITKEGESTLVLGADADNSGFTGTFTETKGIVDASGKFFGGDNNVTGGILNWREGADKADTSTLKVTDGGTISIYGNLRLANPDDIIAQEAATNLYGNIDIAGGAVYISTHDQVVSPQGRVGTVNQSDGYLIVGGEGMVVPGGVVNQTGGVVRIEKGAIVNLDGKAPRNSLSGGDLIISNATVHTQGGFTFNYGPGGGTLVPTSGNLIMGDGALLDTTDNAIHTHTFSGKFAPFSALPGLTPTTTANFTVDIDPQGFRSDIFVFSDGTTTVPAEVVANGHPNQAAITDVTAMPGTVVLSGLNFINSPATKIVPFTIMASPLGLDPGITFMVAENQVETPIGTYSLYSLGEGHYELSFLSFNAQVSRGQAASLAAASGQAYLNSLIFDHVYLDSFDRAEYEGPGHPRQFATAERRLWAKPYFVSENLPFSGKVGDVDSDTYGLIMGLDFPASHFGDGWGFLPTAFVAFNQGTQEYQGVETVQTSGQGGFMGTFSHGGFMASVMGYAGAYRNEMKVAGFRDETNNWFAGAAAKAAYTVEAGENLAFQPYAFLSYHASGEQEWKSAYGKIDMETGPVNTFGAAPGLAMIYDRDDVSLTASVHYMFNFNNKVRGRVGELDLPTLEGGDGYLEYGLGAVHKINDALSLEGKVTLRNGDGLESYGGHIGLSWKF